MGHNTPTPSYISQADGIRSDGCPKECGPRDTMLIPHKKRRKTRSSAIPKARSTAVHGSTCCALIEARPVWRHPWGAKTGVPGQKRSLPTKKRRILGKQKRKCRYKKTSFAPQKDMDSPLTGLIRITLLGTLHLWLSEFFCISFLYKSSEPLFLFFNL